MGYSPRVAVGSPEPGDRADRSLTGALAGKHWRFTLWSVPVSRPPPCGGSHAGRRGAGRPGPPGGGAAGRGAASAVTAGAGAGKCYAATRLNPRPPEGAPVSRFAFVAERANHAVA